MIIYYDEESEFTREQYEFILLRMKRRTMKKCRKCGGAGYKQLSELHEKIICNLCNGTGYDKKKNS